ncbi:uncharacterized protein LOC117590870 [Drosophila guanche]|uniref:Blast:Protein C21orf2 homolog n=1 Tax=Drosophila guanche TaxID=7266 RepID=A0A3B0KTW2_DROGU|nr:uncharacterized protein LOC117590870 [Drosophila guanche]SPP89246.1 blast:Protein C21orf2 homolog [Drosophila guanche]
MRVLREEMVLDKAKTSALERVVNINFVNCDLTDVSVIQRMSKLEIASLSVNGITSLEVFAACPKLKQLYLRANKIEDINEVEHLKNLLDLKVLALEANPCVERAGPGYRGILLRSLPTLTKIDRIDVTQEEITNALCNSDLPDMCDEYAEEPLNPVNPQAQSAQQTQRSLSPQMEEQLVQVSPRPRTPFAAAGHKEPELSLPGTPLQGSRLEKSRSRSPSDSYAGRSVSREDYCDIGPARDYSFQSLDFRQAFSDCQEWGFSGLSLDQQEQQMQLQFQMRSQMRSQMQHPLGYRPNGNGQLETVPDYSQRHCQRRGQRTVASATGKPPQWQTDESDYVQYLMNYPLGGRRMLRENPVHNNILSAMLSLLQELDLAAVQELDNAISKRLRELTRY